MRDGAARHRSALCATEPCRVMTHHNKRLKFECNLKGKTVVISGASRGIGLEIGKRCAKDGANIVILAKTVKSHPKLPGTIFTAAEEIEKEGGKALPI